MSVPSPTLTPNPWLRILDALEKKINRHSYDTWLKPTRYSHSSGGVLFSCGRLRGVLHPRAKSRRAIYAPPARLGPRFSQQEVVSPGHEMAAESRGQHRCPRASEAA